MMITADCFWRTYNRDMARSSVVDMTVEVEVEGAEDNLEILQAILDVARANGMPVGSHVTGCFQVQSDIGIWNHVDAKKIDLTTERKRANVVFQTWEQAEAEEEAAQELMDYERRAEAA